MPTVHTLHLILGRQEAQKAMVAAATSRCGESPAGEIYFCADGASGAFPMKVRGRHDRLMHVEGGRDQERDAPHGQCRDVKAHYREVERSCTVSWARADLGRADLPFSGRHPGRENPGNDPCGPRGAAHHRRFLPRRTSWQRRERAFTDDILSHQMPEIRVTARCRRNGKLEVLIENFEPSSTSTACCRISGRATCTRPSESRGVSPVPLGGSEERFWWKARPRRRWISRWRCVGTDRYR